VLIKLIVKKYQYKYPEWRPRRLPKTLSCYHSAISEPISLKFKFRLYQKNILGQCLTSSKSVVEIVFLDLTTGIFLPFAESFGFVYVLVVQFGSAQSGMITPSQAEWNPLSCMYYWGNLYKVQLDLFCHTYNEHRTEIEMKYRTN